MSTSFDALRTAAVCLTLGGGLFWSAIRSKARLRKIQDTPRSKSISAPQGFVELEGFAWPLGPTVKSKTGLDAVYYTLCLQRQETRGSGKNRKKVWITIFTHVHAEEFLLVDSTGLVKIDPKQAELAIETGTTRGWYSLPQLEKERILNSVIKERVNGFPPSNFFFGLFSSKYRVVEHEIYSGTPMYASGDFRTQGGDAQKVKFVGLTHFCAKVFSGVANGRVRVPKLLDINGDGKVSASEARRGYATAAKGAIAKSTYEKSEEKEFDLHGELGGSTVHKLYIADAFESHLTERLAGGVWYRFIGGALAISFGILVLFGSRDLFDGSKGRDVVVPNVARNIAQAHLNPQELHRKCVTKEVAACLRLIEGVKQFNLSLQNLKYYRQQSCRLGQSSHCD